MCHIAEENLFANRSGRIPGSASSCFFIKCRNKDKFSKIFIILACQSNRIDVRDVYMGQGFSLISVDNGKGAQSFFF
jgi:hypothetical protein